MQSGPTPRVAAAYIAAMLLTVLMAGCKEKQQAPAAPGPPDVEVTDVTQRNVPVYHEWVAQLNGRSQGRHVRSHWHEDPVRSLEDLSRMAESSIDLAVMNSVAQYMTPDELDSAFAVIRRLLKPAGRLVVGDILRPEVGMAKDVLALLKFAGRHGFLKDACYGLASTALSDYRQLRSRIGLQRYGEDEMIEKLARAGFTASRAPANIGHNPWRMTFVARHPFKGR